MVQGGSQLALSTCHPASPGLISTITNFFSEDKLLMLQRLINSGGQRNVDSGLKMWINPI